VGKVRVLAELLQVLAGSQQALVSCAVEPEEGLFQVEPNAPAFGVERAQVILSAGQALLSGLFNPPHRRALIRVQPGPLEVHVSDHVLSLGVAGNCRGQ